MWDGKLSLCFEFQNLNSFGRWKYLRCVHFSILNWTRRLFSRTFSNFSNFLWCHPIWNGNLSLCFEFQYSNSFGRWKFFVLCAFKYTKLHTTAFSRTFSNFSNFLWCHPMWDGKLCLCFEYQYPNSFGRWKYLRRVHFSILNCTRRLFLGRFQTFPNFYDVI